MKALQQRTWNAERRRLQADLDARLDELFLECPTLCGFTLHRHERELLICDLGVYPELGTDQTEALCGEICAMLRELLEERPEAAELLRGRTFARVRH